ncbi:MAG: hypothetical protein ACJ8CR_10010 [Roseiflexaceae bacterium]
MRRRGVWNYRHLEGNHIMAVNQPKRLSPTTIKTDRAALLALKKLADYAPSNAALSVATVCALEEQLRNAEEAEILANKALAAARDARDAAEWNLHNTMLGVKATVSGQYGYNSDAVQALGLKKKMDYRRQPRRRRTPSA